MFNHFIRSLRQGRKFWGINDVPEVAVRPSQQDVTEVREPNLAFQRLPPAQKGILQLYQPA